MTVFGVAVVLFSLLWTIYMAWVTFCIRTSKELPKAMYPEPRQVGGGLIEDAERIENERLGRRLTLLALINLYLVLSGP